MLKTRVFEMAKRQGRSQKWLAGKYGYTPEYLSRIKTGKYPITEEFVKRSLVIFEAPYDALFFEPMVNDPTDSVSDVRETADCR